MVTIVIPNYNGDKYLRGCVESIYRQTYKEYEIIIVDNASKDSDYSWAKEDKRIKFISLEKNYGFSTAVNQGIKLANGEYVLLLNNDTELDENFLTNGISEIKQDEKIFSISSKMIQYNDRKLIDDAGDEYTIVGWAQKRGEGVKVSNYSKVRRVFSTCAGAGLYRRKIFEVIGYFDESFFAYLEDVDISYRANIYGYKNIYSPNCIVYHIGSATSGGGNSEFKIKLSVRNNVFVIYKNMPMIQFVINLPFILVGNMIKKKIYTKLGYEEAYNMGMKEGLAQCKNVNKVLFKWSNIINYFWIQWRLIINTACYILYPYLVKKMTRGEESRAEK